jgi:hypothetical protein
VVEYIWTASLDQFIRGLMQLLRYGTKKINHLLCLRNQMYLCLLCFVVIVSSFPFSFLFPSVIYVGTSKCNLLTPYALNFISLASRVAFVLVSKFFCREEY